MTDFSQYHQLETGQVFEGKYKILREVGRGGFGMVYLAYQVNMDRNVALKVLKPGVNQSVMSAKERFLREVRIISKLKHPNTVTIHDFGESSDGMLYMVLEFVEGETLKQVLKREGPQESLRAATLARQIARSLAEAHRHGVVHRDLKPANIMVTRLESEGDFVKVLDFGVARLLDPKTSDLTSVGLPDGERELIGTPRYMSPEQVRGDSLTGASDIYSLGLMLYEILSGEPAVQGDTTMGLITQQISAEPLKLPSLGRFHPQIQDVIRIATAKRVDERFQTADQMAEALEQAADRIKNEQAAISGSGNYMMASYQSQLANMDPSAFSAGSGQWPSGHWDQSDQFVQPHTPSGAYSPAPQSGFHPATGPHGVPPGPPGPLPPAPHSNYPPAPQPSYPPAHSVPGPVFNHGQDAPQQNFVQPTQPPSPQQPSPQQPSQGPFEHPGIDLDYNEFQATTEVEGLQRRKYQGSGQIPLTSNLDMPQTGPLPPVPEDARPFADEEPSVSKPVPRPTRQQVAMEAPDDGLGAFAFDTIKILVLLTLATGFIYIAFIVIGSVFHTMERGPRLILTALIALAFPALSALLDGTSRDRFRVEVKTSLRIIRVLIGTLVFSMASAMLCSIVLPDRIVRELRTNPNWFMADEGALADQNRDISHAVAGMIETGARNIGRTSRTGPAKPPPPTRDHSTAQPERRVGPAPTRPRQEGMNESAPAPRSPPSTRTPPKKDDDSPEYEPW